MKNKLFQSILGFSGSLLVASCGDSPDTIDLTGSEETDVMSSDPSGSNSDSSDALDDETDNDLEKSQVSVSEPITEDTTWSSDNTYTLSAIVYVENGAVLTIEPGTTILGESGSALVVTRSSRIEAEGSADAPIVFTSAQPEGERGPNDWGGVVLLGSAPNNVAAPVIEGIDPAEDATRINHGGDDPESNCGTLKYARIEFAGFEFSPDNELNALTVGSCGRGTTLDYIQAHYGSDDGIEFFGGTVDIRHAVVSLAEDDSIDWDQGWQGRAQFLIVQHRAVGSDAGFESDNLGDDNDATPRSAPEIANITLVGRSGSGSPGMVLRRGTHGEVYNAIVTGFPAGAVDVRDPGGVSAANAGTLFVDNSIFFNNGEENFPAEEGDADNDDGFDESDFFMSAERANRELDPELADAENSTSPNFMPAADGPAASGAASLPDNGFFDTSVDYVGALEPGGDDWTSGWTSFPAN